MVPKRWTTAAAVVGAIGVLLIAGLVFMIAPIGNAAASTTTAATSLGKTTYSGSATVIEVSTPVGTTKIASTGPLPSSGGERDAKAVTFSNPLVLGRVLASSTRGVNGEVHSFAGFAGVTLLPGTTDAIQALFVLAWAHSNCSGAQAGVEVVDLKIAGREIPVTGAPNQIIKIGLMTLEVNQRSTVNRGNFHSADATALDLRLAVGLGSIVVAHAASDVTCRTTSTTPVNLAVGAGYIAVARGNATFGFVAGEKPGKTIDTVSLVYFGPSGGIRVKALSITSFTGTGDERNFTGACAINGNAGYTYSVTVIDGNAAGHGGGHDYFSITLSNGYKASGKVLGGVIDIQD